MNVREHFKQQATDALNHGGAAITAFMRTIILGFAVLADAIVRLLVVIDRGVNSAQNREKTDCETVGC